MDALGALSGLGVLKNLIPTISFVGVYGGVNNQVNVNTWKFGISTVYTSSPWKLSNNSSESVTTILISPNSVVYPCGLYEATIKFTTTAIDCGQNGGFTALLFNY